MLKKLLILFVPLAFLFAQDKPQEVEQVKELDLLSSDKVETETRYKMFYVQAAGFSFWSHWKYKHFIPTVGIGYRTHKKQHGFDFSINTFPMQICSSRGLIPFFKIFYLNYPLYKKDNFFYWGGGITGIIPPLLAPFGAIGYEFNPKQPVKVFMQLDLTYKCAAINLGLGF